MTELESQLEGSVVLAKRIRALENLNAQLAAEIDRMRPVVEAAQAWYNGTANWSATLAEACAAYEASQPE